MPLRTWSALLALPFTPLPPSSFCSFLSPSFWQSHYVVHTVLDLSMSSGCPWTLASALRVQKHQLCIISSHYASPGLPKQIFLLEFVFNSLVKSFQEMSSPSHTAPEFLDAGSSHPQDNKHVRKDSAIRVPTQSQFQNQLATRKAKGSILTSFVWSVCAQNCLPPFLQAYS